jgi:superfamily I DNA/RNA helicase
MIPSPFQVAIFEAIKSDQKSNLMISAVAGSGKTTTIVKAISMIPSNKSIIMLAFNKKIAEELSARVNLANVQVKTFHAIGLQVCRQLNRSLKVDSFKISNIISDYANYFNINPSDVLGWEKIGKIISIGKSSGVGVIHSNTEETWINLIDHHAIFDNDFEPNLDVIIPALIKCLNKNNKVTNVIDFDDMVYFPILFDLSFPKFDWVFADEVQDSSEINRESLKRMMKDSSRLCVVGDPYQAIYGFRGADSNSMSALMQEFDCVNLPLSVSYRCAKSVVSEAQKVVNHILPSESAPDGSVSIKEKYNQDDFTGDSAIVCRNTAPLVSFTYSLINRGIPAVMLGRDIGKGLVTLIKSLKASDIIDLSGKLELWLKKSLEKAAATGNDSAVDAITDKASCCRIFIESAVNNNVSDLIKSIESFFKDTSESGKVTLCTIHKSKGLEWNKVFVLDKHRFYPKWASKAWMKEQERNIHYVALTRAKSTLVYINSDRWM